jgi:hypothetical protein
MNWDALSAIADVSAVILVALSVVYLAIQVRRSTRATYSQTYYLATSALAELAGLIAADRELARIHRAGLADPQTLTEDEFTQFSHLQISLFRRFENLFFQHESGMIDDDFWVGHRDNILWFFRCPGTQAWWPNRRFGFSRRFREFLDNSQQSAIASFETRRF